MSISHLMDEESIITTTTPPSTQPHLPIIERDDYPPLHIINDRPSIVQTISPTNISDFNNDSANNCTFPKSHINFTNINSTSLFNPPEFVLGHQSPPNHSNTSLQKLSPTLSLQSLPSSFFNGLSIRTAYTAPEFPQHLAEFEANADYIYGLIRTQSNHSLLQLCDEYLARYGMMPCLPNGYVSLAVLARNKLLGDGNMIDANVPSSSTPHNLLAPHNFTHVPTLDTQNEAEGDDLFFFHGTSPHFFDSRPGSSISLDTTHLTSVFHQNNIFFKSNHHLQNGDFHHPLLRSSAPLLQLSSPDYSPLINKDQYDQDLLMGDKHSHQGLNFPEGSDPYLSPFFPSIDHDRQDQLGTDINCTDREESIVPHNHTIYQKLSSNVLHPSIKNHKKQENECKSTETTSSCMTSLHPSSAPVTPVTPPIASPPAFNSNTTLNIYQQKLDKYDEKCHKYPFNVISRTTSDPHHGNGSIHARTQSNSFMNVDKKKYMKLLWESQVYNETHFLGDFHSNFIEKKKVDIDTSSASIGKYPQPLSYNLHNGQSCDHTSQNSLRLHFNSCFITNATIASCNLLTPPDNLYQMKSHRRSSTNSSSFTTSSKSTELSVLSKYIYLQHPSSTTIQDGLAQSGEKPVIGAHSVNITDIDLNNDSDFNKDYYNVYSHSISLFSAAITMKNYEAFWLLLNKIQSMHGVDHSIVYDILELGEYDLYHTVINNSNPIPQKNCNKDKPRHQQLNSYPTEMSYQEYFARSTQVCQYTLLPSINSTSPIPAHPSCPSTVTILGLLFNLLANNASDIANTHFSLLTTALFKYLQQLQSDQRYVKKHYFFHKRSMAWGFNNILYHLIYEYSNANSISNSKLSTTTGTKNTKNRTITYPPETSRNNKINPSIQHDTMLWFKYKWWVPYFNSNSVLELLCSESLQSQHSFLWFIILLHQPYHTITYFATHHIKYPQSCENIPSNVHMVPQTIQLTLPTLHEQFTIFLHQPAEILSRWLYFSVHHQQHIFSEFMNNTEANHGTSYKMLQLLVLNAIVQIFHEPFVISDSLASTVENISYVTENAVLYTNSSEYVDFNHSEDYNIMYLCLEKLFFTETPLLSLFQQADIIHALLQVDIYFDQFNRFTQHYHTHSLLMAGDPHTTTTQDTKHSHISPYSLLSLFAQLPTLLYTTGKPVIIPKLANFFNHYFTSHTCLVGDSAVNPLCNVLTQMNKLNTTYNYQPDYREQSPYISSVFPPHFQNYFQLSWIKWFLLQSQQSQRFVEDVRYLAQNTQLHNCHYNSHSGIITSILTYVVAFYLNFHHTSLFSLITTNANDSHLLDIIHTIQDRVTSAILAPSRNTPQLPDEIDRVMSAIANNPNLILLIFHFSQTESVILWKEIYHSIVTEVNPLHIKNNDETQPSESNDDSDDFPLHFFQLTSPKPNIIFFKQFKIFLVTWLIVIFSYRNCSEQNDGMLSTMTTHCLERYSLLETVFVKQSKDGRQRSASIAPSQTDPTVFAPHLTNHFKTDHKLNTFLKALTFLPDSVEMSPEMICQVITMGDPHISPIHIFYHNNYDPRLIQPLLLQVMKYHDHCDSLYHENTPKTMKTARDELLPPNETQLFLIHQIKRCQAKLVELLTRYEQLLINQQQKYPYQPFSATESSLHNINDEDLIIKALLIQIKPEIIETLTNLITLLRLTRFSIKKFLLFLFLTNNSMPSQASSIPLPPAGIPFPSIPPQPNIPLGLPSPRRTAHSMAIFVQSLLLALFLQFVINTYLYTVPQCQRFVQQNSNQQSARNLYIIQRIANFILICTSPPILRKSAHTSPSSSSSPITPQMDQNTTQYVLSTTPPYIHPVYLGSDAGPNPLQIRNLDTNAAANAPTLHSILTRFDLHPFCRQFMHIITSYHPDDGVKNQTEMPNILTRFFTQPSLLQELFQCSSDETNEQLMVDLDLLNDTAYSKMWHNSIIAATFSTSHRTQQPTSTPQCGKSPSNIGSNRP